MSYQRVVPRDLFNEGNLLTCLGRLAIKLEDRRDHNAVLHQTLEREFSVSQDQSDGSIECYSLALRISDGPRVPLFRPLNSRDKWPLWARIGDEDVRVFDLDGNLSPEFWVEISQPGLARVRREHRA